MSRAITKEEKFDIFVALSTFYDANLITVENDKQSENTIKLRQDLFNLEDKDLNKLSKRAELFNNLPADNQQVWKKYWLEKLKNRGQTNRLDDNIHPEQIVKVLAAEPPIIRDIIFRNLPENLAKKVKLNLADEYNNSLNDAGAIYNKKIAKVIRSKFLSNFVASEDLFEPINVDKLSSTDLENFILEIGIQEIAIFCRGINTKENLARFLKPFEEEDTKKIAKTITKLHHLLSARVVAAEELVSRIVLKELESKAIIGEVGLAQLAKLYVNRDQNARRFTTQKMPIVIADLFTSFIKSFEKESVKFTGSIETELIELADRFNEQK